MHARGVRRTTVMPHASTGPHPFEPASRKDAALTGGVFVTNAAIEEKRECRDAGMGMDAEPFPLFRLEVEMIQKHKWLDQLPNVGRADQPRDRSMTGAACAMHDPGVRYKRKRLGNPAAFSER